MGRSKGLTPMMEAYIAGRRRGLGKSAAARAAGSSNPSVQAARWEKHPEVRAALEAVALAKTNGNGHVPVEVVEAAAEVVSRNPPDAGMDDVELLGRLAYHGRASFDDFVEIEYESVFVDEAQEDGSVKKVEKRRSFPVFNFEKAAKRNQLHNIKELTIKAGFAQAVDGGEPLPWTETKLKLHDAPQNLERLARILKLEPGDSDVKLRRIDEELWRRFLSSMSDQELAGLKAELFGIGNNGNGNGNGSAH